jgi:hypothetical protein
MKRGRQCGLAAVLLPLLCASPAAAQGPSDDASDQLTRSLGPSYAPSSRSATASVGPSGALFPDHVTGLAVSRTPIVQQDGSQTIRRTVVGSLPIGENVNLGIGLFSVNGARTKERDFRRAQPMEDVFSRGKTVAAVGLSLRF